MQKKLLKSNLLQYTLPMSNTTTTTVNKETATSIIGKKVTYRTANSGNEMKYTVKKIDRIGDWFAVYKVIEDDVQKEKLEKFKEIIEKGFELGLNEKELADALDITIKNLRRISEYKAQEVWKTLRFDGIEEIN
jgi:anti-sigma28 factor (negative regulator of flagellin synthesis)